MHWLVKNCNILDEPADVLVCSANPYLNLSGGVGGEILRRYGTEMQERLHAILADRHIKFVPRGEVVEVQSCGTSFKTVLHAIAIDAFYETSPQVVQQVVTTALERAAALNARIVALTALATGYGRMPMTQFAESIRPLLNREFPPIQEIVICVRAAEEKMVLEEKTGLV